MSYTCIVCQEDFLNPYEVFCGKIFRTTDSQTLCRFYICANCTATPNLLKNGCPNCHEKGMPKFVPPGFTDLVMESRPEPKPVVQHVPNLGGVQDCPDFTENAPILVGKRQVKQTNFYQPEERPNKKTLTRFSRCETCKNDTSVRFCDSLSGFACVPCRQKGPHHVCVKNMTVLPQPPQSIGKYT